MNARNIYYHIAYKGKKCKIQLRGHSACKYAIIKACNAMGLEYSPDMALSYGKYFANPESPAPVQWITNGNHANFKIAFSKTYGSNLTYRIFTVHEHTLSSPGRVVYVTSKAKISEILHSYEAATNGNFKNWSVITSSGKMELQDMVSTIQESDIVVTNIVSDKPPAVQISIPTSGETCTVNVSHGNQEYVIQMPSILCVRDIAFIMGLPDPFNASFISVASGKPVEDLLFVSELPAHMDLAVCSL